MQPPASPNARLETPPTAFILPLDSPLADLPNAGGKGTNLARLIRAGFPVPGGFLVTCAAYRRFVTENGLEKKILALIPPDIQSDPAALEQASRRIRALFTSGRMPNELAEALLKQYGRMTAPAVAVRSSATAEDLPEMSFAGQQDTYLNVIGAAALLKAVVDCWSSLWTSRAIGYRLRNAVAQSGLALAVVVQQMVQSQASGVLFTANPLSGLRSETVIDATLGLGEALVSGQVEPDHYVVDSARAAITTRALGSKTVAIHAQAGGGTTRVQVEHRNQAALPDEQILALAKLGQRVGALFGSPQDIEWAWAGDQLHLLQARPITALFPLPEGVPPQPLKAFFSFAAVQGLLDPITPLGRDSLFTVFAAGSGLFGLRVTSSTQKVLYSAGERLWVDFTPLLKNSFGRRVVPVVLSLVEPTIRQAVNSILDDPSLQPGRAGVSWHARLQMGRFLVRLVPNALLNLLLPNQRRKYIVDQGEHLLDLMRKRCQQIESLNSSRSEKLALQAGLLEQLSEHHIRRMLVLFISGVAAGMASWNFLRGLTRQAGADEVSASTRNDLLMQVTRGMPFNPTTEMDLFLWGMARRIRTDPPSRQVFTDTAPGDLAGRFLSGEALPEVLRQEIGRFLARYGGRGLGEIDLGRPRWNEDPTHVFEMLSSFLQIENESLAPDVVFAHGAATAQAAIENLVASLRRTRGGWLKAVLVRFFARRARQIMGIRESPKFFAVRMFGLIRQALLNSARELVQSGQLKEADDLVYLSLAEIQAFATGEPADWTGLIASRRQMYLREMLRRQIPRLLLSDGRAFYEGMSEAASGEDTIAGSPVSPGSAAGRVRVVLDPRQARLQPGEILVCPGTDPSWTPLFLSAAGLVMETGGMMTHGAVVAREYGIPAIVGVDKATLRLQTGQRIRINGSTGQIQLLGEDR
jgi:phosphohistidine swiveling domain-containing protein